MASAQMPRFLKLRQVRLILDDGTQGISTIAMSDFQSILSDEDPSKHN